MNELEQEKKYKNPRVICEFCNVEQSQNNLKRHQKTIPENPKNMTNQVDGYIKKKELEDKHTLPNNTIGTPLILLNKVECQYCKAYKSKDNIKEHEKYCSANPNREEVKPRKEPLDYEQLNKNIVKCKFCGEKFHPSGLPKHEMYCSENPNGKSGYKNEKSWKCQHCSAIFFNHKVKVKHEERCLLNPNIEESSNDMDNLDKLRMLKKTFPEIYALLTPEQVKRFIDDKL